MIYAFDKATHQPLDQFRDINEAADRMETTPTTIRRILDGNKSDLNGVGLVEHTDENKPTLHPLTGDPR